MKKLLIALAAAFIAVASYGQGQVVFANRVTGVFDAPVLVNGTQTGPGPSFSAQLYLQGAGGLQALGSPVAFRAAGAGAAAIADRYWTQTPVDVPLTPAAEGTFVVRAWATALGSFDTAKASGGGWGESAAFKVAVGGGTLPAANLTTLTAFTVLPVIPEPSVIALAVLGGSALLLRRRK